MTTPWVPNELVNAQKMYDRIQAVVAGLPQGFIGEAISGTTVTLTTAGQTYLGGATVTVTVPTGGRRYRVMVKANASTASGAPGRYIVNPAYNTGASASAGTATTFGASYALVNGSTGTSGASSGVTWGTVFLAAGTYTFSVAIQRSSGGSATDGGYAYNVEVEDVGAA